VSRVKGSYGTPSREQVWKSKKRKEKQIEILFEEVMAKNFPNVRKDIDL
jgi:hypothetical protein